MHMEDVTKWDGHQHGDDAAHGSPPGLPHGDGGRPMYTAEQWTDAIEHAGEHLRNIAEACPHCRVSASGCYRCRVLRHVARAVGAAAWQAKEMDGVEELADGRKKHA